MPDLAAASQLGSIRLHEYFGDGWGILFSHPADFTPICTTELGRAAALAPEFLKLDCKLVALSCNDVASHRAWLADITAATGASVEFPILADPDRRLAAQLGMLDQDNLNAAGLPMTVRSVFIVDPSKKVKLILTYPASTGRSFAEIQRALISLQRAAVGVATPADWQPGDETVILPSKKTEDFPGCRVADLPSGKQYLRFVPDPVQNK